MPSPLATPAPWDISARGYAEVTAPFFRNYAQVALDRASVSVGSRVLDIAAGPGTLALLAAQRGCRTTAVDFAPKMIEELRAGAAAAGLSLEAQVADGQALPMAEASFEAAFSMFGLIFFPDRGKGFAEMKRVLVPGGVAVISSWPSLEKAPMLCDVFGVVAKLLPDLPFANDQGVLVTPEAVRKEMGDAGFQTITVEEVSASVESPTLEEAWSFMFRGSPPLILLSKKMGEVAWQKIERGILEKLRAKHGSGRQKLTMVANLGIARKPGC